MTGRDPMEHGWWLASRASGIVALALITLSVTLGLWMAGRVMRKPGLPPGAGGDPRAHGARRADRDRRPRPDAARRPLAASRPGRDRGAVRDGVPAAVDRARDHRRLHGRRARALLLRPQAHRHAPLAEPAQADDPRLRAGRRPHARRGNRRQGALDDRQPGDQRDPGAVPVRDAGAQAGADYRRRVRRTTGISASTAPRSARSRPSRIAGPPRARRSRPAAPRRASPAPPPCGACG